MQMAQVVGNRIEREMNAYMEIISFRLGFNCTELTAFFLGFVHKGISATLAVKSDQILLG